MGESIPEHHRSRLAANAGRQVVASGSVVLLRVADPRGRYPIGQRGCAIGAREQPVFVQRCARHGDDLEVDAAHRDRCHPWSAQVTRVGVEQMTVHRWTPVPIAPRRICPPLGPYRRPHPAHAFRFCHPYRVQSTLTASPARPAGRPPPPRPRTDRGRARRGRAGGARRRCGGGSARTCTAARGGRRTPEARAARCRWPRRRPRPVDRARRGRTRI